MNTLIKRQSISNDSTNKKFKSIQRSTKLLAASELPIIPEKTEKVVEEVLVTTKDSFAKMVQGREELDIINEANKIMRERSKNSGTLGKKSKEGYMRDTKEICLKNYLIDLLKGKRTEINDKEISITKALRESEKRLDKDYKEFATFMEEMKNKHKENENEYLAIKSANDERKRREKNLIHETKQIMDDVERTVKNISNLKSYANFVHKVIGVPSFIKHSTDMEQREKNYESLAEHILNEFSNVDLDEDEYPTYLQDESLLISKFVELEDRVIKLLDWKITYEKEQKKLEAINQSELYELKKREDETKQEYFRLEAEKNRLGKSLKSLTNKKEEEYDQNLIYINELYFESLDLSERNEIKKNLTKKKVRQPNYTKELLDLLLVKENKINTCIASIENIITNKKESSDIYRLIEERKKTNKEAKQRMKKETQEVHEAMKRQKADERSRRIVVKGRKVPKTYLVTKANKKKERKQNINSKDDDYNMLNYSSDELV